MSVKEKLLDISTDHCGTYNKFKNEDCYAIEKSAAVQGRASGLRKFKKSHPHYRLTESSVRTMCDKYHEIIKSSPTTKTISPLKRGRLLMPGSLDKKVKRVLLTLYSKGGMVNTL